MELDEELYSEILRLCEKAEHLVDDKKYEKAMPIFFKAFELLPKPRYRWSAGTWILTAIGDSYFLMGNYEESLDYLKHSEIYPNAVDNEFIQLRIGQSYFELKDTKMAREYLIRAYMVGGDEVFDEENPKYFMCIQDLVV